MNEGVLDVIRRSKCVVHSATSSLTSGQKDYELSTSVLAFITLDVTGAADAQNYTMERVSVDEMVKMRSTGAVAQSPAQFYALAGANKLMLYPTPAAADTLTYYYVPRPTTLSVSSDDPSTSGLPAEFHKLVEWYALAEAGDFDDDQSSAQGERYRQMYERGLLNMMKSIGLKPGRLPRAVLRPYAALTRRDRSIYP